MGVGSGPRFCLLKGEKVADVSVTERVHALVEPLLAAHDVEVVDVEQLGATLRVTVDKPGDIDLDAVSEATLVVSDALDHNDPVPGRYTLEVSSPGVERPLRTPEHFERAVALTCYERIVVEDLPDKIRTYRETHLLIGSDNPTELVPMEEVEHRYIHHVLTAVGGNKTLAARILGFDRKTLYRKLAQYGLEDE